MVIFLNKYSKGNPCCGRYIKNIGEQYRKHYTNNGTQRKEENYMYKLTSEEKEACLVGWNLLAWSMASSMKPLFHL
jgi:hypothetical protein